MIDDTQATPGIVLLASPNPSANIFYHRLREALPQAPVHVILEERVPAKELLRRRARKLGWARTAGQVMFIGYVRAVLEPRGAARRAEIAKRYELDLSTIPSGVITRVPSANSPECHALLARLAPRVVVLAGTRILSRATLQSTPAVFINMHAGVTPAYRGVHGGYWALADGRSDLVGTTIHQVDEGIDTGQVIDQRFVAPTSADTFSTYHMLQLGVGLPALIDAVKEALEGSTKSRPGAAHPSSLRSHPTLWEYAKARVLRGVR